MEDHNAKLEEIKKQLQVEKQHVLLEQALTEFDDRIKPLLSEMTYPTYKQFSLILMNLFNEIDFANLQKLQDTWRE